MAAAILAILVLAAFVLLVAGVRSSDKHMSLCDSDDPGAARGFARRVLGVYVRQQAPRDDRCEVRR